MIKVGRRRKDARGRWIKPNADWFGEARRLTRRALGEGAAHKVTSHYRDEQVKMALEKLFYGKCVYCESELGVEADWDVEHYRPKGRVAERADHPGYYWLAYDWTNLYAACEHCNQKRKDLPRWRSPTWSDAQGKLDQFPVDDEDGRAMTPADSLAGELPYLLDPCIDEPSWYLRYDIQGQIYPTDENVFGNETIRICHLKRSRLRVARGKKIARVCEFMALREVIDAGDSEALAIVQRMLDAEADSGSEYAGVARAILDDPEAFGLATS